jgi:hypothetical protein
MFSRDALLSFSAAKKDALYDLLNREDLDWRKLQLLTAKKVLKANSKKQISAFVIDDTVGTYSDPKDVSLLEAIEEKEWALDFFRNFQLNTKSLFVTHGLKLKEIENDIANIDYRQYGLNDTWFFEYYDDGGQGAFEFNKVRINLDHPIFESNPFLKLESSRKNFEILNACFERLDREDKGRATYHLQNAIHQQEKGFLSEKRGEDLDRLISVVQKYLEDKLDVNYKSIHKSLPILLWVVRAVLKAMPDLDELVHLGPLRKVPELVKDSS